MRRLLPVFSLVLVLALAAPAAAQQPHSLTPAALGELERSCPSDAPLRAAQHALAQVDGDTLSENWEQITAVDPYFTLRLKDEKVTDQKETGRCWMFAALNLMRPAAAKRLGVADLELSQNYLFFFEKLEKANLFLDEVTRTKDRPYSDRTVEFLFKQNVQDGQNWLGFVQLVDKYGVVPKEVMPETHSSSHSRHVARVLGLRLKRAAMEIRRAAAPAEAEAIRLAAMKDVYRILAINFGTPPKEFSWRYETRDKKLTAARTYTPQQFYREVVGTVLDDYDCFYSVPTLAFDRKYEIDLDKVTSDGGNLYFVNIPLEAMKDLARKSLQDSSAVWFGCDVGQESNSGSGLMAPRLYDYESLYGTSFRLSRQDLFETYTDVPTHAMVFTGMDVADGKVKKWLVENSWGESRGRSGYFTMLDEWFDDYVQAIVVHRKYVPPQLAAVFKTQATVLPPWDPMYGRLR
ncbi:MAG TPA: C1 family peptidase [Candidatus Saccharimonadales bacterium]|nr:C1 family peptidase [Candidatus Saccharimonadales bacterium]